MQLDTRIEHAVSNDSVVGAAEHEGNAVGATRHVAALSYSRTRTREEKGARVMEPGTACWSRSR